jgi:hypothetical protein
MTITAAELAALKQASGCSTPKEVAAYLHRLAEEVAPGEVAPGRKPRPESPRPPTEEDDDEQQEAYAASRALAEIVGEVARVKGIGFTEALGAVKLDPAHRALCERVANEDRPGQQAPIMGLRRRPS